MESIDWDNINHELDHCHRALMKVWNEYREQMYRRGYVTMDATQELCARVLKNRKQFQGRTRAQFSAWSLVIFRNLIREKLRRRRPEQFGSESDVVDAQQDSPNQELQTEMRQVLYDLTRAALSESERVLIELRFEENLSLAAVSVRLQKDYPKIWAAYPEWSKESELDGACKRARQRFDAEARRIHKLLEGGSPDECSPAE